MIPVRFPTRRPNLAVRIVIAIAAFFAGASLRALGTALAVTFLLLIVVAEIQRLDDQNEESGIQPVTMQYQQETK